MFRASLTKSLATGWLLVSAALLNQGCADMGVACAAIALSAFNVTVVDAVTNQAVCDVTVTAAEGAFSERLMANGCRYHGAYERPGRYSLRAERSGFRPAVVENVVVSLGRGPCVHVETVDVTIALERAVGAPVLNNWGEVKP